jgi:hypothetical protein
MSAGIHDLRSAKFGPSLWRESAWRCFGGQWFLKASGLHASMNWATSKRPSCGRPPPSVPRVADALIGYLLALPGNEDVLSINPVVGEA